METYPQKAQKFCLLDFCVECYGNHEECILVSSFDGGK
jgi:hypothetical protein